MIKDGHVSVAKVPNTRYSLNAVRQIGSELNNAVGEENVDCYIKEYYEEQCSYVCFTVDEKVYDKLPTNYK